MVRLKVLFPNKSGSNFNWEYYKSTHHPLVEEKLKGNGLLKYEVDKGIGTVRGNEVNGTYTLTKKKGKRTK